MKIKYVEAENFQSYPTFSFYYNDLGLALVSGPTGVGKSTALDAPAWILFGQTSKDGASDDIKAWGGEGLTWGSADVELPSGAITVVRKRGNSTQNDLYWLEEGSTEEHRGKDLTETQKLLETRLGVSAALFFTGSYMAQFSKADSFFVAKAKDRREALEQIADQDFAILLGDKASEARKAAKKVKEALDLELGRLESQIETLKSALVGLKRGALLWETEQDAKCKALILKRDTFQSKKAADVAKIVDEMAEVHEQLKEKGIYTVPIQEIETKLTGLSGIRQRHRELCDVLYARRADASVLDREIAALKSRPTECYACKQPIDSKADAPFLADLIKTREIASREFPKIETEVAQLTDDLKQEDGLRRELASLRRDLADNELRGQKILALQDKANAIEAQENHYEEQLVAAILEKNPHGAQIPEYEDKIAAAEAAAYAAAGSLRGTEARISALTWLFDKSFELRGLLMAKVVSQIEKQTNAYLEKHFDAALRIRLVIQDSDKIDVEISNDGWEASFRQLSGGERCMLKLCFSLSLMQAAQNKAGVAFEMLMLDEPMNGLDEELKVKAFSLLQHLEKDYPTVLVVEHSTELKQAFSRVFTVDKVGGHSEIYEQS